MNTLRVICVLCVFVDIASTEERNFRIYFEEFAIKYKSPDIFERADCTLLQINNRSYVNAEMILKRSIGDIDVRASMELWKPNSVKQKLKLYDVRINGCSFLRSVHANKLFQIYLKSFKKHANVNLLCPLKANYSYKLKDWFFDELDLPPYAPLGQFRTLTEYYSQKKLVIRFVTSGEIMAKV